MTKQEFIDLLAEELEVEDVRLEESTILKSLVEWDSMAIMVVIGLLDENFGIKVTAEQFKSIKTIGSIIEVIGEDKFE